MKLLGQRACTLVILMAATVSRILPLCCHRVLPDYLPKLFAQIICPDYLPNVTAYAAVLLPRRFFKKRFHLVNLEGGKGILLWF